MQRRITLLAFLTLLAVSAFAADRDPAPLMQADRDFAKATAEKSVDGWIADGDNVKHKLVTSE